MSIKGSNRSRLRRLEKEYKAGQPEEWVSVMEDMDQPGVFKDGAGKIYSEEELESLDASGVNIIKIVWKKDAPPPGARSLHEQEEE